MLVQAGLCRTCSETTLLVFPRDGSNDAKTRIGWGGGFRFLYLTFYVYTRPCGAMDDHSNKSVCGDGERQIVWAWAMDADGRKLPKGYAVILKNVWFAPRGLHQN